MTYRCPVCRDEWDDEDMARRCADLDREIDAMIRRRRAELSTSKTKGSK